MNQFPSNSNIDSMTNRLKLTALIFTFAMLHFTGSTAVAQTTIDFNSLPTPASGFFNGDTNAGSPYRDNFVITGSRDNFGQPETLQLWQLEGVDFFNGYTPAYASWNGFSWSNIVDSSTPGFANQYAAFPGAASDGTYAIGFGDTFFNLPENTKASSLEIANTTYAALVMLDGDTNNIAKKFGGESGDDEDLFSVTLTGFDQLNGTGNVTGSVEHILADYRFANNSLDYVQDDWAQIGLDGLGNARSVRLSFFSTDTGSFGINTPTYVAIDNLTITAVPEPNSLFFCSAIVIASLSRRRRN